MMSSHQTIAILDFGSQYTQLIARRVRENHVRSIIFQGDTPLKTLLQDRVQGIIFSGGPGSVYDPAAPTCDPALLESGIPILGICYGMQLVCKELGGEVTAAAAREYGRTPLVIRNLDPLFDNVTPSTFVWMSHGDTVQSLSGDFESLAETPGCPYAAIRLPAKRFWGLQFHPEVTHTPEGMRILRNFVYHICGCRGDWQVGNIVQERVRHLREQIAADTRVICGLSGGVDSSVTAALLHRAVGDQLVCVFVDNGLLRKGERGIVRATFRDHFRMDLHTVHAEEKFLKSLEGIVDPQHKRRTIGHVFVDVFREEASSIPNAHYLAQGTLYPDVIESGGTAGGLASSIKLHHNVGGLPDELGFELIEPLRDLFKDEVRLMGEHLGLPQEIITRHPFPGPGLAVRIVGEVTRSRCDVLREVDEIVIEEIRASGWYGKISQAFAVLLPVQSVGIGGDKRSYELTQVVVIRFVETEDFMTADWVRVDYEILARISSRITNEVAGINRVLYDVSTKPPATIEWE